MTTFAPPCSWSSLHIMTQSTDYVVQRCVPKWTGEVTPDGAWEASTCKEPLGKSPISSCPTCRTGEEAKGRAGPQPHRCAGVQRGFGQGRSMLHPASQRFVQQLRRCRKAAVNMRAADRSRFLEALIGRCLPPLVLRLCCPIRGSRRASRCAAFLDADMQTWQSKRQTM